MAERLETIYTAKYQGSKYTFDTTRFLGRDKIYGSLAIERETKDGNRRFRNPKDFKQLREFKNLITQVVGVDRKTPLSEIGKTLSDWKTQRDSRITVVNNRLNQVIMPLFGYDPNSSHDVELFKQDLKDACKGHDEAVNKSKAMLNLAYSDILPLMPK